MTLDVETEKLTQVQLALPNGKHRIGKKGALLQRAWFPPSECPVGDDYIRADYATDPENPIEKSLVRQFEDEVYALEGLLDPQELQSGGKILTAPREFARRFFSNREDPDWEAHTGSVLRPEYAAQQVLKEKLLDLWEENGLPLRVYGDTVYRIWRPIQTFGKPVIKSIPLREYVIALAEQTARDQAEIMALKRKLEIWGIVGTLAMIALLYSMLAR